MLYLGIKTKITSQKTQTHEKIIDRFSHRCFCSL